VENYAQVSREHGPAAADLILGDVAVVLKRQLRDSVLARVDQNTFLAFLPAEIAPMAGELDQLMKVLRFVQRTSIRGVIRPKLNAALRNATQARSARR
jgi:GGDEF domain-containing protein